MVDDGGGVEEILPYSPKIMMSLYIYRHPHSALH